MRPATDAFKAAVATSHQPVVRVDVLRNGQTIRSIDTVTDGTVTLDASANVRGRCDLTVIDDGTQDLIPTAVDDALAPYGNEVRVWRGIEGELISLGIFRIDNPRVSEDGGMPTIQITGQDRSARIIDARFETRHTVEAGTNIADAILDVITPVYPDVQTAFVDTSATTGTVVAEPQDDRWEFASKLALGAGMRLFFDGDGVLVLAPEVASGAAGVELVEGDGGLLVTASREWNREGARNVIVATGENAAEAVPARGVAEDDNPLSPTYVYGQFGRVVGFYSSPVLTTDDQAADAAQTILARSTGTTQRVDFGSLVLPYLEPGDVARITRHRIGINETHVIDSLTIPLATGGVMSGRTRAISDSVYEPPPPAPAPEPAPDTEPPSAPVLSATPGVGEVELDWTAATDNVGVTEYEVWYDSTYVTTLPPSTLSYTVTGLAAGVSRNFRVVAYDAEHNYRNSNIVAATPEAEPPPAVTANSVYADGTVLRLVDDGSVFSARGGNAHSNGFSWGQSDWDAMAAQGWNCVRLLLNWKLIETAPGVFSATQVNHVKTSIARAATAGIKTIVCLCITSPQWSDRTNKLPDWSYDAGGPVTPVAPWDGTSLFDVFMSHGEAYSRKMIQELGADENVIGFDHWNEPDHQPANEVQQGTERFLGWARDEPNGADKLWFVATVPYSSQSSAESFNDWDAITDWTNVVLQVHSYFAPASATDDGWRTDNGMRDGGPTFWNGGPEASSYNTANKAAMRNHFAPWKATSVLRGVPWILGEFGVQYNKADATTRDNWARDMVEAAELEDCAGVFWWIYAINTGSDPWSARSGSTWRPEALRTGSFDA